MLINNLWSRKERDKDTSTQRNTESEKNNTKTISKVGYQEDEEETLTFVLDYGQ
jgi:hypothetical protein